MTLLLDTHFLLWIANGDQRLTPKAKKIISAADAVYMSAASMWEISIKVSVGKLAVDVDALTDSLLNAGLVDRKSTRLNSSHLDLSRMPSSA